MKRAWYHCGHCGSLFESGADQNEGRICGECGRAPDTGVWPTGDGDIPARAELGGFNKKGDELDEGGQRAVRKKRRKSMMMRVVVIWLSVMLLAIWLRHHNANVEAERDARLRKKITDMAKGTMADERIALLAKALPDCHRSLSGFLTGGTPEVRNQYVADPIETAGKMAMFYRTNPFPDVDVASLRRVAQEAILVGGEWMIETRWKGAEGVEFDAVF